MLTRSVYFEFKRYVINVEKQKALPLVYEEVKMDIGYRIDLLVENKLVVELKSVEAINEVHIAQLITYLKLSNCKLGLLLNIDVKSLKNGIKRIVNNL